MRTSFPLQPETKELLYKRKGVLNRTAWVDSTETDGFILPLGMTAWSENEVWPEGYAQWESYG